ncbi:uncharacterized protein LOC100378782 [Saccoglossus kowalevskii]|uniref:Cell number regulator 10-like n=1 Tax=Saccoglossus kowalevskii TaxID=10224 RepID=A0ABM0GXM2_SACKO|nr:PREDICTED: cell number regulator 10-like [Saccoglossus kowalevskii]
MPNEYNNGLFSCFNNLGLCVVTYFAPCYTQGKVAEAVGDDCLLCGLSVFVPLLDIWARASIRGKVREQKGIEGGFIGDLCLACWCYPCSLMQDAQEMNIPSPFGSSMART